MKYIQLILSTVLVLLVTVQAMANRNQARERRQQHRIVEGVRSGELNRKEAKALRKQQRHIDRMQEKAMSDGELSAKEKFRIEKAQDRANKAIYEQKHDDDKRGQ